MGRLKAPQRREQLIEVATKLFAKFGYEATTTAAIAEAAGVTEPILYRHFKSKHDMFIAITRAVSEQTLASWAALIGHGTDPAQKIRLVASEFPNHLKTLADAYHVIHGALATSRDKKVLGVLREHYGEIERFFVKIVSNGQESGVFRRDMDPKVAAWQLIHVGIGYAMIALNLANFDFVSVEQTIEFILRGMK